MRSFGMSRYAHSAIFVLLFLASMTPAAAQPWALTLAAAEDLLRHNREILASQRAVEGADAGVTIAGQAPNPSVSYSAVSLSPRSGIGSGGIADKRIDQTMAISQLIERGDKRELRSAAANALARASRSDLADIHRQQRLALHLAYYDLKAAAARVQSGDETAALYRRSLEAAVLRQRVGDLAAVDVSRLRVEMLRADNDVRQAQADLIKARWTLAYLIGQEVRADDLVPADDWPTPETPVLPTAPIESRPAMKAATARIEAADQARQLARRLRTRDVTLTGQVERNRTADPPESGVTYGVSISVPLFVRYGYEGESVKAEVDYNAALEDRDRILAQAGNDAAKAQADLAAAAERLSRTNTVVLPEAQRVAAAAEFAYSKGAMALTDLLDAHRTLRAVELEGVAARADYAKARAVWLAATEWESNTK